MRESADREREDRAISDTVAKVRTVVRDLNRIARRIDRTLSNRLRRLETLRQ